MATRTLALDAAASRLAVRTRAVGMLARLAHDLELRATEIEGRAEVDGDTWSGELGVRVAGLEIAGVLKNERVDANVLSTPDRAEILKRMQADAFRGEPTVKVRASGTTRDQATVVVVVGSRESKSSVAIRTGEEHGAIIVRGSAPLSLKAIGSREIKAPLGAFSVKDEVSIVFDLRFV